MTALTMHISGMSCNHCVGAVTKALRGVQGVVVDEVSIGRAAVQYDEALTSPAQITLAVEDEGYPVTTTS